MARHLNEVARDLIHGLNCYCCPSNSDKERSPIELGPVPPTLPEERPAAEEAAAVQREAVEATKSLTGEGSSSAGRRALIEDITPPALRITIQSIDFSEFQEWGARIRRWIDDPQEPNCHITKSTLTWQQLADKGFTFRRGERTSLGDIDPDKMDITIPGNVSRFYAGSNDDITCTWDGFTAEGAIALCTIKRQKGCIAPPISQVTQALYTRDHAIDGLRYVFVRTVVNQETLDFVQLELYTEAYGLEWPSWVPRAWDIGTPQCDALLGTRIGKVVGYLILGAFDRGTRRIKRIYTWPSMSGSSVNFRFDLEVIG
ncbi:hypothetical protein N7448_001019 [Penicillium atrosanguineum]|nr:hypothetical protein N7448_001019 [Penicillium atrosanguineum]